MAFKFNAEVRQAQGKGASRRLRHNGQIPAIIYGGSGAPVSIILNHDELNNAQAHDSFYSDVITHLNQNWFTLTSNVLNF